MQQISTVCLAARARRLNRLITALYDDALRPFGLRIGQLNLLVAAALGDTARPAELCRRLDLDPSTLSRNLQILRRQGWIEFLEDSSDARAQPFHLTALGRELIERAHPAWRRAQERAEALLGPETVMALSLSTSTPRPARARSSHRR